MLSKNRGKGPLVLSWLMERIVFLPSWVQLPGEPLDGSKAWFLSAGFQVSSQPARNRESTVAAQGPAEGPSRAPLPPLQTCCAKCQTTLGALPLFWLRWLSWKTFLDVELLYQSLWIILRPLIYIAELPSEKIVLINILPRMEVCVSAPTLLQGVVYFGEGSIVFLKKSLS